MGCVQGAVCTRHRVTTVTCEGSQRCHRRALFALACHGLEGGICGRMPRVAWATCMLRAACAAACVPGRVVLPAHRGQHPPSLKEHFEPFWKCLDETSPMLEET